MNFRREFKAAAKDMDWHVQGMLTRNNKVIRFGSDSKVLSTIFELLITPIIQNIAFNHGYNLELAPQTKYPDFTLTKPNHKHIAIDVKTCYRKENCRSIRYTLGSCKMKKALYPMHEYSKHWVVGFLYSRKGVDGCPYSDVEYFVQEKYRIAGMKLASGNTQNISSFPTCDIRDLSAGIGPFKNEAEMYEYWGVEF